jgi:hypothetical protein
MCKRNTDPMNMRLKTRTVTGSTWGPGASSEYTTPPGPFLFEDEEGADPGFLLLLKVK